MTATAMETNLDGVQETEKAIRSVDKGQKKKLRGMSNEEVKVFCLSTNNKKTLKRIL
jgi:hypothetical protein